MLFHFRVELDNLYRPISNMSISVVYYLSTNCWVNSKVPEKDKIKNYIKDHDHRIGSTSGCFFFGGGRK